MERITTARRGTSSRIAALALLLVQAAPGLAQQGADGDKVIGASTQSVNEYTSLTTSVAAGSTTLTVADSALNASGRFASSLHAGDLILVYQVQGVTITGDTEVANVDDTSWGAVTDYRQSGRHEFAQVKSVPDGTTIEIDSGLVNAYEVGTARRAQVVRIPRYASLTMNAGGILTCDDWNGTVGGVLAVEVAGNVVLNAGASIDATGKGFRGGSLASDNVTSAGVTRTFSTDPTHGAEKGESVAGYQADYDARGGRYCRSGAANGGGGGNGENAGGGGGANASNGAPWTGLGIPDNNPIYTAAWNVESATILSLNSATSSGGGRGGYSRSTLNANAGTTGPNNSGAWGGDGRRSDAGGLGGRPLDYSSGRIFLGGGGGAGDQDNNMGGAGGDGGGLVYMLVYGSVSGNGSVVANGANGSPAQGTPPNTSYSGRDGAGGGGAGGSIVLRSTGSIASGISLSANGGAGGNQVMIAGPFFFGTITEAEGPGGGGSGGYVAVSTGTPSRSANGANNGTTTSAALTEFPPNGAMRGCPGSSNASVTSWSISTTPVTIHTGSTANPSAAFTGTPPSGATLQWYAAATGGSPLGSGTSFTTPVLTDTTTYYVGSDPGWFRVPVVVTVLPPECAAGTYSATGNEPCTPCPVGYVSADPGQLVCTPCSAGTFVDLEGQASCTPCAAGTFADTPGLAACSPCAPGSYSGAEGQATCTPCAAACGSSEYEATACTATTDRVCSACDASCVTCSGPGTAGCTSRPACSAGSYSVNGEEPCSPCPAGSVAGGEGLTSCTNCSPGSFAALPGQSSCTTCSASCTDGEYEATACTATTDRACEACDASCTTCVGPGPGGCNVTTTTLPSTEACDDTPRTDCSDQPYARIRMRAPASPDGRVLEFVGRRGPTSFSDFGDPANGATSVRLCIYSASARVLELEVPAGGTCGADPCWTQRGERGFEYLDPTRSVGGMRELVLRANPEGESRLRVKARGESLAVPGLPLATPVRVQVVSDTAGTIDCWEADFPTLEQNDARKIQGRR